MSNPNFAFVKTTYLTDLWKIIGPAFSMTILFFFSNLIGRGSLPAYAAGFTLDFIALIVIPGYVLCIRFLRLNASRFVILIPALGFVFQLFVFLMIYSLDSVSLFSDVSFATRFLALSSTILVLLATVVEWRRNPIDRNTGILLSLKTNIVLITILSIALAFRVFFFQASSTPATDGALYLAQARSLVVQGTLAGPVVGDSPAIPFWTQLGLSTHPIVVFALGLFFVIGDPTYQSGKLMSLFSGIMLVGITYYFSRELFGNLAGAVAGTLVAIQPWIVFWSVVLYGPEILGSLLLVTFLALVAVQAHRRDFSFGSTAISSAVLILLLGAEYPAFLSLFLGLPIVLASFFPLTSRLRALVAISSLVLVSAPFAYYASRPDFFILTQTSLAYLVSVPVLLFSFLAVYRLRRTPLWLKPSIALFGVLNIGFQVVLARADVAKWGISAGQLAAKPIPATSALSPFYYLALARAHEFFSLQGEFWELQLATLGGITIVVGLVSLVLGRKFGKRLLLLIIAAIGSLFYTIGPVSSDLLSPNWWNFRLVIPFVPLFSILASSICRPEGIQRQIGNRVVRIPSKAIAISLVIIVLVSSVPSYFQASNALQVFNDQALWGPVSTWAASTPPNSVFLVYDPYSWTWLTARPSATLRVYLPDLTPSSQATNLRTIITLIQQYGANYVVFDSSNAVTNRVVAAYFQDPTNSPFGFSLKFTNSAQGVTIWVYDVSAILHLTRAVSVSSLGIIENAEVYAGTPNASYPLLKTLAVGWGSSLAESRIYMKFNSSSIPIGATIIDARIIVPIGYSYASNVTTSPLTLDARITSGNWSSQSLTWINQPSLRDYSLSNATLTSSFSGYVSFRFRSASVDPSGMSIVLLPVGLATMFRYAAVYSIQAAADSATTGVAPALPSVEILYLAP